MKLWGLVDGEIKDLRAEIASLKTEIARLQSENAKYTRGIPADVESKLTLTAVEREAINEAIQAFGEFAGDEVYVVALRALLERAK